VQTRRFIIVFFVVNLAACTPSVVPIDTATAQPTSTLIPISMLNFESILIEEDDLPAGYYGAHLQAPDPLFFTQFNASVPDYSIYQGLEIDKKLAGFVMVLVYENQEDVEIAYQNLLQPQDARSLNDVGDKAKIWSGPSVLVNYDFVGVMAIRCHALVGIVIERTDRDESAITYAERLVNRLPPRVCR
jgi:hypothetical protein